MKTIGLLDTSIASKNVGDQIIMDAVTKELRQIFRFSQFVTVPTHDYLGKESYKLLQLCERKIVGGTNLLSSNMRVYNQWKVNLFDVLKLGGVSLMGVGWWQYQTPPDRYTSFLLSRILSSECRHSVRDEYTRAQLQAAGIHNVINTGCPTLWQLTPDHCREIPTEKSDSVVLTFTDYKPLAQKDEYVFQVLIRNYSKVYLWLQGNGDYAYAKKILGGNIDKVEIVGPSLEEYDSLLSEESELDYVGTRLHAGIRAMQFKRRSIILSVDNRAREMGANFGLPVLARSDSDKLKERVRGAFVTSLNVPWDAIQQWKLQWGAV